jgi:hypothetical protein
MIVRSGRRHGPARGGITAFIHPLEGVQKIHPVLVAFENGLFLVASGGNVIHPVRDHDRIMKNETSQTKIIGYHATSGCTDFF